MSSDQATVAEEEYLQIIYWLQEAGLPMTGANLARAMQVSAPTVHEMIGRLEGDGYVTRADGQVAELHRERPRARRPDRAPPPADRALPDRRLRHPVGSGARGGRAARALDVARRRGAHAARDRRRQDLPARPPDLRGRPRAGRAAGGREEGATVRVLRFENEAEDLLHYLKDTGLHPGLEGTLDESGDEEIVIDRRRGRARDHPQRGRDGLGGGRPLAAAAGGAAGPARAGQRALRALTEAPRTSKLADPNGPASCPVVTGAASPLRPGGRAPAGAAGALRPRSC